MYLAILSDGNIETKKYVNSLSFKFETLAQLNDFIELVSDSFIGYYEIKITKGELD